MLLTVSCDTSPRERSVYHCHFVANSLQVRFVNAGSKHIRVVFPEDRHDLLREVTVALEMVGLKDELWTELLRCSSVRGSVDLVLYVLLVFDYVSSDSPSTPPAPQSASKRSPGSAYIVDRSRAS